MHLCYCNYGNSMTFYNIKIIATCSNFIFLTIELHHALAFFGKFCYHRIKPN